MGPRLEESVEDGGRQCLPRGKSVKENIVPRSVNPKWSTLGKFDKDKYRKWYYEHNKVRHCKTIERARKRFRIWVDSLKQGKSCCFCGEGCFACLDWHHRRMKTKSFSIGSVKGKNRVSKVRVLAEVKKCEVVCSNCHRKLHAGIIKWKERAVWK